MSDVDKATPRPWRVEEDVRTDRRYGDEGPEYIAGLDIVSDDDVIIGSEGINGDGEKERANAALIVAAVNGHDQMQARIAELTAAIRDFFRDDDTISRAEVLRRDIGPEIYDRRNAKRAELLAMVDRAALNGGEKK